MSGGGGGVESTWNIYLHIGPYNLLYLCASEPPICQTARTNKTRKHHDHRPAKFILLFVKTTVDVDVIVIKSPLDFLPD